MARELVLITGSNGAIGYEVVLHTLRAGYKVRAVVRSQEKVNAVANGPSIKAFDSETQGRLSFAIVPDLLKPDAYDQALEDVTFVIHVASPIPVSSPTPVASPIPVGKANSYEDDIIKPAVQGTMNIIKAAERNPSVKRVVITSSVLAQIPFATYVSGNILDTYNEESRIPDPVGPYKLGPEAYFASKALALNAAERWKKEKSRRIELIYIHPGSVQGRIELARSPDDILTSSNRWTLLQLLGKTSIPNHTSNTCSVEDVAEVHVRALLNSIPDGQSLTVVAEAPNGVVWAHGEEIIQKRFPKAVAKGVLPNDAWVPTVLWRYNVAETERLIGMKFEGLQKQIEDVAGQYLEMTGEELA